ncbi:MAG: hypothetical protein WBQ44_20225, partial [Rhodococcus sp. (in: high G+C Gram-positive bacteria)]
MLAPERRRRSDVVAAAAIVVVAVLVFGVVWLKSDARGTTSDTANPPLPQLTTAQAVPVTLAERWRADSSVTAAPVATGSAIVSGEGGVVTGIDPADGSTAWRYSRDIPLCAVTGAWNTAVVVYRDDRGCSQVTQLDGASGTRKAQRTSDADATVTLFDDGTYVTSRGDSRLELWRSDLVRTLEYGRVDAPVNPNSQPRSGCTLSSAASTSSRVAVLENCPGESAARLTTLAPAPDDAQQPEEYGSSVVAALTAADGPIDGAKILFASGDRVVLAIPAHGNTPARVALFDGNAQPLTDYVIPAEVSGQGSFEATPAVTQAADVYTWWTGTGTLA